MITLKQIFGDIWQLTARTVFKVKIQAFSAFSVGNLSLRNLIGRLEWKKINLTLYNMRILRLCFPDSINPTGSKMDAKLPEKSFASEIFAPKEVGETVNVHVVDYVREPEPDFEELNRVVKGAGVSTGA